MKRPFAFIGFTCAVTLIVLNLIPIEAVTPAVFSLMIMLAVSLLIKKFRQAKVLPIVLGSVIFACFVFMMVGFNSVFPARALDGVSAQATFKIVDIPRYNEESSRYSYVIETSSICQENAPQKIKIKIYSDLKVDADYYDEVSAKLRFFNSGSSAFDSYGNYSDGIYTCASVVNIDSVKSGTKPPNYYVLKLREKISDIFTLNLKDDAAAMSIALITGDKDLMPVEAQSNIRNCGLSHYFAVSGFHISLVCLSFNHILRILGVKKYFNTFLTLILMLLYCGLTGFSMSCVRACVMTAVMLFSKCLDYKSDTLNSLGISVLILCFNPFSVTDPSAVMTVCAVLGITVIYKGISLRLNLKNVFLLKIIKLFLLPICVLIAVTPAVYLFFGSMSLIAVLVNAFIELPVAAVVFLSVAFCFAFRIPVISNVLGNCISVLSRMLYNAFAFLSEKLSFLNFDISSEIFGLAIAAVLIFTGFCLIVRKNVSVKATAVFTLVVMMLSFGADAYEKSHTNRIVISEFGCVMFYDMENAVIIGVNNKLDFSLADNISNGKDTVFIDSGKYLAKRNLYEIGYHSYEDMKMKLDENIEIEIFDGKVALTAGDKKFIIDDKSVMVGNAKFSRMLSKTYDSASSVELIFSKNSQIIVRREGLWQK